MQVHSVTVPAGCCIRRLGLRPLTRHKYNSEPSLNYRTTRGKVELEHDLHSVYTVHSAL